MADIEHVLRALDDVGADHLGLVLKIETAQGSPRSRATPTKRATKP